MKRAIAFIILATLAIPAFAADTTEAVLKKAQIEAKAQNKNILVKFSASWCTWCHRMSDWLTKTDEGKMVADQYIIVTLVVDEAADKKDLENPGANDLKTKLGGDKQGIPFFAIMDKDLKTMVNSIQKGDKPGNIGFPVEDFEIAHFLRMISTTSKLTKAQINKAEISLKENAKKIRGGG